MALVTVNVPTYDRDQSLRRAIRSALDQTITDLEVNVSDNAASPTTRALVESFGDPRLTYLPLEKNVGVYGNLTRCLHLGSSPFVLMLHDDDVLYPECLALLLNALKSAPAAGIAHSAINYTNGDGDVTLRHVNWADATADQYERGSEFIERTLCTATRVAFSAALMRRKAVCAERVDPHEGAYCDMGLWLRIARSWDVMYIHRPLAGVAIHPDSSSAAQGLQQQDGTGEAIVAADGVSPHRPRDFVGRRAQVAIVRHVKVKFVREHLADRNARRGAVKSIRRTARHELKSIIADSLDDQSSWSTIRDLRHSARIEPTILLTTWPMLLAAAKVIGRVPYDRLVTQRSRS